VRGNREGGIALAKGRKWTHNRCFCVIYAFELLVNNYFASYSAWTNYYLSVCARETLREMYSRRERMSMRINSSCVIQTFILSIRPLKLCWGSLMPYIVDWRVAMGGGPPWVIKPNSCQAPGLGSIVGSM
jgi:hypothetical protein